MLLRRSAGFSLIELMVTVAIIGILATVAQSNYMKFKIRARQTEAKGLLSALFTAEQSFHAEYSSYQIHLPVVGYMPEGVMKVDDYPAEATSNRIYSIGIHSGSGLSAPTELWKLNLNPGSLDYDPHLAYRTTNSKCPLGNQGILICDQTLGSGTPTIGFADTDSFTAMVCGCPDVPTADFTKADVWSITHTRVLKNVQSSL